MEFKKGGIVISSAGRDKGRYLAVVDIADEKIFVCDGRERPVERPKAKNPKHLKATRYCVSDDEMTTNRALRKALASFGKAQSGEPQGGL